MMQSDDVIESAAGENVNFSDRTLLVLVSDTIQNALWKSDFFSDILGRGMT